LSNTAAVSPVPISDISEVLIKKAKIAGELSPSGSHISSLIEQRRKYEEELNNRTRIHKNRYKWDSIIQNRRIRRKT